MTGFIVFAAFVVLLFVWPDVIDTLEDLTPDYEVDL